MSAQLWFPQKLACTVLILQKKKKIILGASGAYRGQLGPFGGSMWGQIQDEWLLLFLDGSHVFLEACLGVILGPSGAYRGQHEDPLEGPFGNKSRWVTYLDIWWILRLFWSQLGAIRGLLGIFLGPSGAYRGQCEGPLEGPFVAQDEWLILIFDGSQIFLGANLRQFGAYLNSSWDPLELTEGSLRALWRVHLGTKSRWVTHLDLWWKHLLEPTCGNLEPTWDHLRTIWSLPKATWGPFGDPFGTTPR